MARRHGCGGDGTSTLSAISTASDAWLMPVSRIRNSSPPWRLTVSAPRTADSRQAPPAAAPGRPTAWPRVSLICLKRSRSRNSSARRSRRRRGVAMALRETVHQQHAVGQCRQARPVSAVRDSSLSAWRGGSASACVRSIDSTSCSLASTSWSPGSRRPGFPHARSLAAATVSPGPPPPVLQSLPVRARRPGRCRDRAGRSSTVGLRMLQVLSRRAALARRQLRPTLRGRPAAEQAFVVRAASRRCGCRRRRCCTGATRSNARCRAP